MADWELKGKPALLVLHMQHDIAGKGGKGEPMGFPQACEKAGIIPKIQNLATAFRQKNLNVIYCVAEFNPLVPTPTYGLFYDYMRNEKPNAPNSKGTQIIPDLEPAWGEPVVRSWNIGIFSNSNLDAVLKHYAIETLVLTGVTTNLVVHIGAVQATDLGYSVIVPRDAVTSNDLEAHEYSLTKVLPLIAQVTDTEAITARLSLV